MSETTTDGRETRPRRGNRGYALLLALALALLTSALGAILLQAVLGLEVVA